MFFLVNGKWSKWHDASNDYCEQVDGTWKKPSYRFCSSPRPKFGGICPEDENGITNVTAVECTNPSKYCLNWQKKSIN